MKPGERHARIASTVVGGPVTIDVSPGKTVRAICQGASGSGKSVLLSTLLCALAECPYRQQVVFDDKYVSFVELLPRIYIFDQQVGYNDVLASLCGELKRRLVALKALKKKALTPYDGYDMIDVVVDEASSFLNPDDSAVTKTMREERLRMLCNLGQLGRAVGFSLIVATQVASSKHVDTSLRNLLVDAKFGFRSGSQESTRFLTGDRYDEAPMEILPDVPGLMYCMSNDGSTGNHFVKCKAVMTPPEAMERIARRTAAHKKELTFLDASSDDYAF